MGIKIRHGDPKAQISAAKAIGEEKKAEREQVRQEQIAFQTAIRQQDIMLSLEKEERAKRWEIDKMELASRLDFERKEKVRQRKLDNIDNSLTQIDKEVQAGRMSEEEAYPLRLKLELNKTGVDAPTSLIPKEPDEDKQYGIPPYWMRGKDAPEGTPERQLYEAKLQEAVSGERGGTIPWYLTPKNINTPAGIQAQEEHGIFLTDEEREQAFSESVRQPEEIPTISTDAEYDALPSGAVFFDPQGNKRRKP